MSAKEVTEYQGKLENVVEAEIKLHLERLGWLVTKIDSGQAARARKGRTEGKKGYSSLPDGFPDLLVQRGPLAFFLEIKKEFGGVVSLKQKLFHLYLQAFEIPVWVVRSVLEVDRALLEFWGQVKRYLSACGALEQVKAGKGD